MCDRWPQTIYAFIPCEAHVIGCRSQGILALIREMSSFEDVGNQGDALAYQFISEGSYIFGLLVCRIVCRDGGSIWVGLGTFALRMCLYPVEVLIAILERLVPG